jgi:hexokinase
MVHTPASASVSAFHATITREAFLRLLSSTIIVTPITLTTVKRGAQFAGIIAIGGVCKTSLRFSTMARAQVSSLMGVWQSFGQR